MSHQKEGKKNKREKKMTYVGLALRCPALDNVVHPFSLLNHFPSSLVNELVDSWGWILAVNQVSFFRACDAWLDMMAKMLGPLKVRFHELLLKRKDI